MWPGRFTPRRLIAIFVYETTGRQIVVASLLQQTGSFPCALSSAAFGVRNNAFIHCADVNACHLFN